MAKQGRPRKSDESRKTALIHVPLTVEEKARWVAAAGAESVASLVRRAVHEYLLANERAA